MNDPINKFTIRVSEKYGICGFSTICKWLNWATTRKVKIFDFSVHYDNFFRFSRFHDFTSIVDLRLSGITIVVDELNCSSLLNLKKLNLDRVKFDDNLGASKFFCFCLNLAELDICNPTLESNKKNPHIVFKLCVHALKLERLKVQSEKSCQVRVFAPCLEYLTFKGYDWKDIRLECVCPLVEAHIYLIHRNDGGYRMAYDTYRWKVLKRLKYMAVAKCMSIDFSYIQTSDKTFPYLGKDFPIFHNLESLKLRTDPHGRLLLCQVLENAPKLKHLSLTVNPGKCRCGHYWRLPHSLPSCLLSCLESIEVMWTSREDMLDFLKDILKNATVLKRMKISAHCTLFGDLLKFTCASTACQILLLPAKKSESSSADSESSSDSLDSESSSESSSSEDD